MPAKTAQKRKPRKSEPQTRDVAEPLRSIFADFLLHTSSVAELAAWLSVVLDGRTPDGAVAPRNEWPLDHFMAVLGQHGSREQVLLVGQAAGELLLDWGRQHTHVDRLSDAAVKRLSAILSVLEAIPAPRDVAMDLYYMSRQNAFDRATSEDDSIRRQVLGALALRPPEGMTAREVHEFFAQYLDDPDLTGTAFDGIRRLSLHLAIDEIPRLLRALKVTETPPHEVIWDLFREMEITHALGEARHLRDVLQGEPQLAAEVDEALKLLNVAEDYPNAWRAYSGADAASQTAVETAPNHNGTKADGHAAKGRGNGVADTPIYVALRRLEEMPPSASLLDWRAPAATAA